jgi:molybdopterin-binding protein
MLRALGTNGSGHVLPTSNSHHDTVSNETVRRNVVPGTIKDVKKGTTTRHVLLDIGGGKVITASVTNEAVEELQLAAGKKASAVIKASDVMVMVD